MRCLACVALLACCLSLTGCSLFGKRSSSGTNASTGGGGSSLPSLDRNLGTPTALDRNNPPSQFGGILAGQVVDAYGSKHSSAYIQVTDSREQGAAPIDVAADQNGYFTIQGLNPGRSYQLVARVRESDKIIAAGTTYAIPPNPRVVIRVSEEFVSSTTPPLPPYPALPGSGGSPRPATPDQPKKPAATLERPQPSSGAAPTPEHSVEPPSPARAGVELMPPRVTPGAVAPSENFVREEPPRGPNTPRPAIIPGPPVPPPPVPSPVPGPTSHWQPPTTQIPFCLVSNHKLENFALYDINGQPWEFRRNNHARLILLDFWGTWCPPCRAAIPHLVQLQRQYGQQGLDVIGIAYEEGTTEEQTRKVKAMRDRLGINYRLLLGADADRCPVKTEMRVAGFPTLILLDEHGHMLWQTEGLDPAKARQLDGEVRRRLGLR